jgi:hypothetical protein
VANENIHPFCNICGWRKGGPDSWDGRACKCGLSELPMPAELIEAINKQLRKAETGE